MREALAFRRKAGGLAVAVAFLALAFHGVPAQAGMEEPDAALLATPPLDRPPAVVPARASDLGLAPGGGPVTPLSGLHLGTYPVSPPPGMDPRGDLLALNHAINVARDGRPFEYGVERRRSVAPSVPLSPGDGPEPQATAAFEGVFQYEEREFDEGGFTGTTWMRPVRHADVEYYDVDTGEVLGTSFTNDTGYFRMQVNDTLTRDVAFRALTTSRYRPGLFNASVTQLPSQGGQPYALTSPVYFNHDPATPIDFTGQPVNATAATVGGPFHILDLAESAERYVENLTSASPSVNLTVYWSAGYDEGKYYDTNGHVFLPGTSGDDDSYDDSVILHEIGHYLTMSYSREAGYYGPHGLAGTVDIRLAYTEALGSYFMGAIREYLNLSQPLIYVETDGTNLRWFGFSLSYDTDTPSSYSDGVFVDTTAANEVAVAHALYDVVDGAASRDGTVGSDDDAMDLPDLAGDRLVWDVLVSIRENATLFTKEITMETFFDQWLLVNPGYAAAFTQILLAHGIEYAPDPYEGDDTFPAATSIQTDGSLHHHTFYPAGDEDWSVFNATGGEEYVIATKDLLDGADTVLELYDSDGTTLLAMNNDRDASTKSSLLTVSATGSQTHYVRVFRHAEIPTPIGDYGKYNLTVYALPNPQINAVSPASGSVAGGTPVTVSGSNFTTGASVFFGVYEGTGVTVLDASTITATTPANVPGSVDVTVANPPNADGLVPQGTLAGGFTYTGSALPPILRSITPDFGASSVATNVTVAGDYFLAGATLEFDAILSASHTVVDPKTIVATVQPLPVAAYDVVVRNPGGLLDTLVNGFESASRAFDPAGASFDSGNPLSRTLSITDDFEIMDLYVHANITHPEMYWGGVRIELESPSGQVVRVLDRILVADSTGAGWRTRINATFGYDEAPSEVLWQFRGERTVGTWTLHLSVALDGGTPSTLHSWILYFFQYRHEDVSRIVLTAAEYRNYVTGFDEVAGEQLYRVRLQAANPNNHASFPTTVAVTRDQRHACGGGYSDYNVTRGGWTDSAVTCFELMTGKVVRVFSFSGNLQVDGLEAARYADRLVAATNEFVYLIDSTTLQLVGSVPTGFPASAPIPHQGITPDGRKAYITNESGQSVLVVDLDNLTAVGQIDVSGYTPLDIDVTGDGTAGYISCAESPSAFQKFDPTTDTIVDTLPVSSLRPVQTVLTPDGAKAFYTHYQFYAGSSRMDLTTNATTALLPHPESTTLGLAMGRDGTLYIADWYIQRIWVYNASTEVLRKDILVPDQVYPRGIDVGEVVERVALTAYGGNGYTNLSWGTPRSYGTPVQGYTIYRGTATGEEVWYASVGVANTYVDTGVVNGETYYYRVGATNGAGEGAWSNEAVATPNAYFPQIASVAAAPDPQSVGGPVNITATVTDVLPVAGVWVIVTDPLSGSTNSSMARVGTTDDFYLEAPYGILGAHTFVVWAVNADGNWNSSAVAGFTILPDSVPPEISEVRADPDPQDVGGNVNITARVVDNLGVSGVWVNVTSPDGGSWNTTMVRAGFTDAFFLDEVYGRVGAFSYRIWAEDAAGNFGTATGSFVVVDRYGPELGDLQVTPPRQEILDRVNVSVAITDNHALFATAWIHLTDPLGAETNQTMIPGLGDRWFLEASYAELGTYSFTIWARDLVGNWNSTSSTFEIRDTTPPSAVAGPDRDVLTGATVQFDASSSMDNSGTVANFTWRISSGAATVAILYGPFASFSFPERGNYTVTLIVMDLSGNIGENSLRVVVADPQGTGDGGLSLVFGLLLLLAIVTAVLVILYFFRRKATPPSEPTSEEETSTAEPAASEGFSHKDASDGTD